MDFGLCRGINRTECKFDGGIGYAYIPIDGSIIGAGFGLEFMILIYSKILNLLIATLVGLFVSTLYFYISPFGSAIGVVANFT
jgi:hypothetical protein